MKLLSIILVSFLFESNAFPFIKEKYAPKSSDAKFFLPYSENMMSVPNFPESLLKKITLKGKRLYKVPVSLLSDWGLEIKPGSKVQSVDLMSGKKFEYTVKETVNAIYSPNQMENLETGHLYIILNDESSILEGYSNTTSYEFLIKGFSYFGNERKIYQAKERLIPTKPVNGKFVFKNKVWDPMQKGVEIRSVKFFDNVLYVKNNRNEGYLFEPIIKTKDGFYPLSVNNSILTKDLEFLKVAQWGEDTEVLMLPDSSAYEDFCVDLFFIKAGGISYVPLPCSQKDR